MQEEEVEVEVLAEEVAVGAVAEDLVAAEAVEVGDAEVAVAALEVAVAALEVVVAAEVEEAFVVDAEEVF